MENKKNSDNKKPISNMRSVERSLDLLECFVLNQRELSLTEISEITELSLSTVHRLTGVLTDKMYLTRNESNKKYFLGPKVMQLGSAYISIIQKELVSIAKPYLEKMYERFQETVGLYVLEGDYRLCVDRIQTTQLLRNVVPIGQMIHLSLGGVGKILLAYIPEERIKTIIPDYTAELFTTLDEIRENKYYISYGERVEGIVAIGIPILDYLGEIVCVLSTSGPTVRFSEESTKEKLAYLTELGREFSREMGYQEEYNTFKI